MSMKTTFLQARAALDAGERFAHAAMPEEIARSWQRCLRVGLEPGGEPVDAVISYQELQLARQQNERLMEIVRPELELLSSQIAGTNYMTAFADANGTVLDAIMDAEFHAAECSRSVRPGSIWREDLRGTNALGLALFTGQTSMVTGPEHFFTRHGGVSCVCAPIFASDGKIVGLLDASSEVSDRQYHTKALVSLAATNIENRLFIESHRRDYIIQFHPRVEYLATQSVGMVSVTEDGYVTGANRSSARLLSGMNFLTMNRFSDIFGGTFRSILRKLIQGDTVELSDGLNASYFARLRPMSRPRSGHAPAQEVTLRAPRLYRLEPQEQELVFDDELLRECLRVARRAADVGQPVCIHGATGTGKTAMAEVIHRHLHPAKPLIVVDCRRLTQDTDMRGVIGELMQATAPSGLSLAQGGTLLLEHVSALAGLAADELNVLLDSVRRDVAAGHWYVVATDQPHQDQTHIRTRTIAGVNMLTVDLPGLKARTDFDKLARIMLTDLSSQHQLSAKALRKLASMERPGNLNDLRHHLQVLVASCPAGIVRETQVEHFFPSHQSETRACGRCLGVPMREKRCLEVRRVFQICQCNVALTARRLGISRNTVYSHLKD
ncbi:GAF domain-containing protein [Celeribacter baekdonensis]|uniref:sigma-54-dependent Fis family transcriptional regulator n=1 Tax=Celeribacter baekdonensis TaxID=875171 RepID=UPI0030D8FBB9|tara:strand:- start:201730 stop:203556 length:1827 start_codon:yes stop_codon:yes gene_type:complete